MVPVVNLVNIKPTKSAQLELGCGNFAGRRNSGHNHNYTIIDYKGLRAIMDGIVQNKLLRNQSLLFKGHRKTYRISLGFYILKICRKP